MDKYCSKCGSPLDENGVCPKCAEAFTEQAENTEAVNTAESAMKEEKAEQSAPQTSEEPKTAAEPATEAPAEPNTAEAEPKAIKPVESAASDDEQPSRFTLTAKQVFNVIKNFFTKNAVDAVAAQYGEKLPIWGILLPAYVVISAISATATFNSSGNYSNELTNLMKNVSFGAGEVFFINFAITAVTGFALSIAVRAFIKLHKGDGHFLNSANLVTATFLPSMMIGLFNIITGGVVSGLLTSFFTLAQCASYMLLFAGISKALGGKKPIWSFFLMIICSAVVAFVVTLLIVSPILFSRVAYSIMDTFKY